MKLFLNYSAGCIRQARHKPIHGKGPGATPAPFGCARGYH
jgi:hypothetical protein